MLTPKINAETEADSIFDQGGILFPFPPSLITTSHTTKYTPSRPHTQRKLTLPAHPRCECDDCASHYYIASWPDHLRRRQRRLKGEQLFRSVPSSSALQTTQSAALSWALAALATSARCMPGRTRSHVLPAVASTLLPGSADYAHSASAAASLGGTITCRVG